MTSKVECYSLFLSAFLAIFYNFIAIIMRLIMHDQNIQTRHEFYKSSLLVVLFEVYLVINCIINLILTVALTYLTIRLYRAVNHFFYKQKGQMHKILIILAIIILIVSILSVIGDFLFCFIGQVKKHSSEESTPTSYFRGFNIECAAGWIAPLLLNLLYISNYRSNACSSYLKIISEELKVNGPEEVNKQQSSDVLNQTAKDNASQKRRNMDSFDLMKS